MIDRKLDASVASLVFGWKNVHLDATHQAWIGVAPGNELGVFTEVPFFTSNGEDDNTVLDFVHNNWERVDAAKFGEELCRIIIKRIYGNVDEENPDWFRDALPHMYKRGDYARTALAVGVPSPHNTT